MMFSLAGKGAVVTGGAAGIGHAIVRRFVDAGARVTVFDVAEPSDPIDGVGYRVVDVGDEAAYASALQDAAADTGLDILVSNAGIQPLGPTLAQTTDALLDETFRVNVRGVLYGLRLAPDHMPRGGRIINLGSFIALRAAPRVSAYGLSKNAVLYVTRVAAIELAPRRITVNCICPGTVNTPAVTGIPDNPELAWLERVCPMKRMAEPEEVAAACHFLASDEAGYITGQALAVDGGATAGWAEHDVIPPPQIQDGRWVARQPVHSGGGV